jgi:hypothetical protein
MVTQEQIDRIQATGKRSQGPLIDAAIDSLVQNGRNHKEAFAELAEALDRSPGALSQGYYRRRAQMHGPARKPKPVPEPIVFPTPQVVRATSTSAHGNGAVQEARDAMLNAIAAYAEAVANERLAEIRKVLG